MRAAISKILAGNGTCKDVLRCLFGLGEFEMIVYRTLVKNGPSRSDSLSPVLKKDKSTVYRALQKLTNAGLVVKQSHTLKRGGHFHTYAAIPPEKVSERIKQCVDEWFNSVQTALARNDIP